MALRSVLFCRSAQTLTLTLTLTLPFPSHGSSSAASAAAPLLRSAPLRIFGPRCLSSSPSPPSSVATTPAASSEIPTPESADSQAAESGSGAGVLVDALDIRVGKVVKAWKHPEAESLYVEEVDIGEPDGPRTICSGLVKFLSLEELQERHVIVLANLKPRNMRGVKSNGMLLAASDATHENVELLTPPEGSVPGERAWFGTLDDKASQGEAATPNQLQKKKIWEAIQPQLKTTEDCIVTFKEKPMQTSAGFVSCKSLKGANVG